MGTKSNLKVNEVLKAFPGKEYRRYQEGTLKMIAEAFNSGIKCIILSAPTGSGKSFINATFGGLTKSFYCTPQLTLIDQLNSDPYLAGRFTEMKGRGNYQCVYDAKAACDLGLCKRQRDFPCKKTKECPYWLQKQKALKSKCVLMSFAYFILEGRTDTPLSFGNRELLILDEAHSIDKYVLDHVNLEISPYRLPLKFYERISPNLQNFKTIESLQAYVNVAYEYAKMELQGYEQLTLDGKVLTISDAISQIKLEDFMHKAKQFTETQNAEWVWDLKFITLKDQKIRKRFVAQPLYATLFMRDAVWRRAQKYIISSATILNHELFIREVGLDRVLSRDKILVINVPSVFSAENRLVIDSSVGKMSLQDQVENIPKAVRRIEDILEVEKGNVAIHCPSYKLAKAVDEALSKDIKERVIIHESKDRVQQLAKWKDSRGKVFICVSLMEGQDWRGDICTAQILVKVPYPDLSDKRVAERLRRKDWTWFKTEALKETIQAYGRAVRTENDVARFYILDSTAWELISWSWRHIPQWFKDALPDKRNKDKIREAKAKAKQTEREMKKLGFR